MKEKSVWRQIGLVFAAVMLLSMCVFPKQVRAASNLSKYSNVKVYDITAYGADKTGKKSIDTAIEAALAEARKDIKKGNLGGKSKALIYFPKGTFKSTSLIIIRDGMIVVAENKTTVKFSGEGGIKFYEAKNSSIEGGKWISSHNQITIGATNSPKLSIKNLKVQSGTMGIKFAGGSAVIENVNVSKCLNIGLTMTRAEITVKNSKFNNNGHANKIDERSHGVGVYDHSKLTISNAEMNNNRKCGICVRDSVLIMKNCKINDNGRHALDTGVGTNNISMTNCDMINNGHTDKQDGVLLKAGSTGKFVNCNFKSNAISSILLDKSKISATFKGCTFSENDAHNIYVYNTNPGKIKITIDGCSFSKCKSGDSIMFYLTSADGYSLKVKGKNTFKNINPKYVFWINGRYSYKN